MRSATPTPWPRAPCRSTREPARGRDGPSRGSRTRAAPRPGRPRPRPCAPARFGTRPDPGVPRGGRSRTRVYEGLEQRSDALVLDIGNDEIRAAEDLLVRVRDGDAEAGPVEQLTVVLAVAARDG